MAWHPPTKPLLAPSNTEDKESEIKWRMYVNLIMDTNNAHLVKTYLIGAICLVLVLSSMQRAKGQGPKFSQRLQNSPLLKDLPHHR